jgi:DNA-binding NarL/FixJ family response regulator
MASATRKSRRARAGGTERPAAAREPRAPAEPVRVVLAEEDFLAREGITRVLEGLEGVELVAPCGDLESVRAAIERDNPDVVVTDIRLPPGRTDEGVRLAVELRTTHPDVAVIVLSDQVESLHAAGLFAGGSHRRAYLLKRRVQAAGELSRAIYAVAGGGAAVDPGVIDQLVSSESPGDSSLHGLTLAERRVLALIAEGHANAEIAKRLAITKRGVERHINSIFAKLRLGNSEGVSRRVKAALIFLGDAGRLDNPAP